MMYLFNVMEVFYRLPDQKMNEEAFVCYVMGYRMNLEQLAVARFGIQKELGKHVTASPSSGAN